MKCPICKRALVEIFLAENIVLSCPKKHGLWFPNRLFAAVLQNLETENIENLPSGKNIFQHAVRSSNKPNFPQKKCPTCLDELISYNYSYNSNIFFDKCFSCRGIWLDKGELKTAVLYVKGDPKTRKKSIRITKKQKGYRRNISNLPRVCVSPPCPAPLAKKIDFTRKFIEAQYDKPGKIILSVFAWDTIVILNHATTQIAEILITMCRLGPEGKRHAYYIILAIIAAIFSLIIFIFTL